MVKQISIPEILNGVHCHHRVFQMSTHHVQLGFPVADIPGCVETRSSAAGDQQIYRMIHAATVTLWAEMEPVSAVFEAPGTTDLWISKATTD